MYKLFQNHIIESDRQDNLIIYKSWMHSYYFRSKFCTNET